MKTYCTFVALFVFPLQVLAQNAPPPGIVIPFDQEKDEESDVKKKASTKKDPSSKSSKSSDFLKTAKPRSAKKTVERSKPPKGSVISGSKDRKKITPTTKQKIEAKRKPKKVKKAANPARTNPQPSAKKRRSPATKSIKRRVQSKKQRSKRRKKALSRKQKRPRKGTTVSKKMSSRSSRQKDRTAKQKARRRKTQAKPPRQVEKRKLSGAGLVNTFETPLGQLGTIPRIQAERVRALLGGRTERDEKPIKFRQASFQMDRQSESRLSAIADFVNANPSILSIFVIGHADDSLNPSRSSLLSEARASAVAEGLVRNGVGPERILAYGVDREFPNSPLAEENRRVEVEYIYQNQALRQASDVVDTVSILHFAGLGTKLVKQQRSAISVPSILRPESSLTVETGELTLLLPSGRQVSIRGKSTVDIKQVVKTEEKCEEHLFLQVGMLKVSLPSLKSESTSACTLHIDGPDFGVNFNRAAGTLMSKSDAVSLTLDAGRTRIDFQNGPALFVNEGQAMTKDRAGIGVYQRLPRPLQSRTTSDAPITHLKWIPVPNAVNYIIEASSDLSFFKNVKRYERSLPIMQIDELVKGTPWYVRIYGVDEYGTLGLPSATVSHPEKR